MYIDDWKSGKVFRFNNFLFVILIIVVLLISCQKEPQQTATVVAVVPTQTTAVLAQPNPAVATELAIEALEATTAPTAQPTETPTSQQCVPPEGWVAYTIQPGDTLLSLANATGITIADIKAANCMLQDLLVAGEKLYLPFLPPPPPPPPAPVIPAPPVTAEPPASPEPNCETPFSCPGDLGLTLVVDPGGGNRPVGFEPCTSGAEIEFDTTTKIMEIGERRYIYVCLDNAVEARLTNDNGLDEIVKLEANIPDPDLKPGNMKAVIDRPILPDQPTGIYTMTVSFSDREPLPFRFRVDPATEERILVIPPADEPGSTFQIYYVFFDHMQTLNVRLYYEDGPLVDGVRTTTDRKNGAWKVTINQLLPGNNNGKGWAHLPLSSVETDPTGVYAIALEGQDDCDEGIACSLIWLNSPD